jgi:hypothetical protein
MSAAAFPLSWPDGRPRTRHPAEARFRDGNSGGKRVSFDLARDRLEAQLGKLGAANVILSMNIRLTLSGRRDMNQSRGEPLDKGVALYFDLHDRPHVLACDRWNRVADNIAAIAAHIEALRGQERWGVADLRQAFAGHVALPAPDPWWEVLGFEHDAIPSIGDLERAYRLKAKSAHPDAPGGSRAAWDRLNAAYEAAKRERG